MFKHIKTSLPGIGAIVTGVGLLITGKIAEGVTSVFAGIGLLGAKDYNK